MHEVTIKEVAGYRYEVDLGDPNIRMAFEHWFEAKCSGSSFQKVWDYKTQKFTGKREFHTEFIPHDDRPATHLKGDTKVILKRGLITWMVWWLTMGNGSKMPLKFSPLNYMTADKPYIAFPAGDHRVPKLSDEWRKTFESHPRGDYYVQAQLEAFNNLTRYRHSSVELGTGLGKSEILLALCSHFVGKAASEMETLPINSDRNLLIMVPGNAIRDELIDRTTKDHLKHHGVRIGVNDWSADNRINVINPVGFMNSGQATNPDAILWLRNVEVVLVDEAHRLSAKSYADLFDAYLLNVTRSLAVSGSLDKIDGQYLNPNHVNVQVMQPDNSAVIGFSGVCRMRKKVAVKTSIYSIYCSLTNADAYQAIIDEELATAKEAHWNNKLALMIESEHTPRLVQYVWDHVATKHNDKRSKLYVPFYTRDSGMYLAEQTYKLGLDTCYWASGTVWFNGEIVGSDLSDVKRLSAENAFQVLYTSSVSYEGVDLSGMNAVMPMLGSSWSRIAQPIGRAARGSSLDIYFVFDRNNAMTYNQTKSRREKVVKEYQIEHVEKLNYKV